MRTVLFLFFAALASGCTASDAPAQDELERAFPQLSFNQPVDLQHAGDGSGRLFVVEQSGRIIVFNGDAEDASASVFLDIRDRVVSGGERGLLGLAFHPNFSENGQFFVDYTAPNPLRTVVARYEIDPSDASRADPSSEEIILEVEQPFGNHNAGQIVFGPEGYLYVTLGDGGSGGDPRGNGQDRSTLLGSILRIDVDSPTGERAYGIPNDNPFAGNEQGFQEEIYAHGLRNPWRISFDPATGDLWAGDVGQNAYEEVDRVEKGENYGWNVMEGRHCYEPRSGCDRTGLALPVWEYEHSLGQSITGGYVYRGDRLPDLRGAYVYGDYVSGRIWALRVSGADTSNTLLLDSDLNVSSFGVDAEGELYVLDYSGGIYQFAASDTGTEQSGRLQSFRVERAAPNPFRNAVSITYAMERSSHVTLRIYDALGRRVETLVDGQRRAGTHEVTFQAKGLSAGIYIARFRAGLAEATQQLVLAR